MKESRVVKVLGLGFGLLLLAGCGGDSTPAAPTPPPPANVQGNWTGTLESNEWASQAIVVRIEQVASNFTGTWVNGNGVWTGTLSGTVDTSRMTATMTLNWGFCSGPATASISGEAGGQTMIWRSVGFTGICRQPLPTNVVMRLQLQTQR